MRPFPSLVLACLPVIIAPAALAAPAHLAQPARPSAEPAPWSVRADASDPHRGKKVPGATPLAEALRAATTEG
ncbi:MAG: hypothetical protein OSB43_22675, partial [Nocardioides sp.]